MPAGARTAEEKIVGPGGLLAQPTKRLVEAARKLIYLAIQNAAPQRTRTRGWTQAPLAFNIAFGDRLPD